MMRALQKHGSRGRPYIQSRESISEELMKIRFSAKQIEALCDGVRKLVEEVRTNERTIMALCIDKARMPRQHFIKEFPGKEGNLRWIKGEIEASRPWSGTLERFEPAIVEKQQKLLDETFKAKREQSGNQQGDAFNVSPPGQPMEFGPGIFMAPFGMTIAGIFRIIMSPTRISGSKTSAPITVPFAVSILVTKSSGSVRIPTRAASSNVSATTLAPVSKTKETAISLILASTINFPLIAGGTIVIFGFMLGTGSGSLRNS